MKGIEGEIGGIFYSGLVFFL